MLKGNESIESKYEKSKSDISDLELRRKIDEENNHETLLKLVILGGEPLIKKRPKVPRRILRLAAKAENQKQADDTRIKVAQHFPESLGVTDLPWLRRLRLRDSEIYTIKNLLNDGRNLEFPRRVNFVRRLYKLEAFDNESTAFDEYSNFSLDSAIFLKAHYRALIFDRRSADAMALLQNIQERADSAEFEGIARELSCHIPEGKGGFEVFPQDIREKENATLRLNEIARTLDEDATVQIDGWRHLETGIIYRRGLSDTALIIYPGPQTVKNAEAWTRVIMQCHRLGVGQVCLHRRLDRHLTGLGPWEGRPETTIHSLVEALGNVGIQRIATAGASGTALAATIAGAEIDAAGVLLMPAVTHFPDPETEPDIRASRAAAREFSRLPLGNYDARPYLQGKTVPVWAHLSKGCDFDRRQIDHISDYPHLNVVGHDYNVHSILPWLAQQDLLEEEVSDFFRAIGWIDK